MRKSAVRSLSEVRIRSMEYQRCGCFGLVRTFMGVGVRRLTELRSFQGGFLCLVRPFPRSGQGGFAELRPLKSSTFRPVHPLLCCCMRRLTKLRGPEESGNLCLICAFTRLGNRGFAE